MPNQRIRETEILEHIEKGVSNMAFHRTCCSCGAGTKQCNGLLVLVRENDVKIYD